MAQKNDYTVIAFYNNASTKKWAYVHSLFGFAKFLNRSNPGWVYINVYNRRTGEYLKRFKPGDFIPSFI